MKKFRNIVLSLTLLVIILVSSGYSRSTTTSQNSEEVAVLENKQNQTINLFVTHGHCSTPFAGIVDDLKVSLQKRTDLGNPLEDMKISFEVDPNSFNVCAGDDLTSRIKTPGLFIGMNNEKITFRSTNVYTMGLDWYQINGKMSIKGIEKDVKLFATGIRDSKDTMSSLLVLEGQMNLFDWGIDYDKIVNGKSDTVPTKLMYINMKIKIH
ncbi:YceI family protein [Psychroserpens sp.]